MTSLRLLFAELRYRRLNFLFSLLSVTVAAALFVAGPAMMAGYGDQTRRLLAELKQTTQAEIAQLEAQANADLQRMHKESADELALMEDETRKLMLAMGFNLAIVHQDTNMTDFWSTDFSTVDMPQEYVNTLAAAKELTLVEHLVAKLQQKVEWQGRKVLLVGYLPETPKPGQPVKKPMGYNIPLGQVFLGHELAIGRKQGEAIEVLGKTLTIGKVLPEQGSKEDISINMHLSDAQEVLQKPEKINQIMALGCRCAGERLPQIRQQLAAVLPNTKITEFASIAVARAEQRDMIAEKKAKMLSAVAADKQKILDDLAAKNRKIVADAEAARGNVQQLIDTLAAIAIPGIVVISGIWVGLLAWTNVRDRRAEIGLLRALGKGTSNIAMLFLGKAVLIGLAGGAIGFGVVLASFAGINAWAQMRGLAAPFSATHFAVARDVLIWSLLGAPLVCVLASYLPMLSAVTHDPAVVLRDA